jgi:hypothetical protein
VRGKSAHPATGSCDRIVTPPRSPASNRVPAAPEVPDGPLGAELTALIDNLLETKGSERLAPEKIDGFVTGMSHGWTGFSRTPCRLLPQLRPTRRTLTGTGRQRRVLLGRRPDARCQSTEVADLPACRPGTLHCVDKRLTAGGFLPGRICPTYSALLRAIRTQTASGLQVVSWPRPLAAPLGVTASRPSSMTSVGRSSRVRQACTRSSNRATAASLPQSVELPPASRRGTRNNLHCRPRPMDHRRMLASNSSPLAG